MIKVRKTRAGWVVEITNEIDGFLEAGGMVGREVLYKRATLAELGIDYDADPNVWLPHFHVTPLDFLFRADPDRVLKAGSRIV